MWTPDNDSDGVWVPISTPENSISKNKHQPPYSVMRNAFTLGSLANMTISWFELNSTFRYYFSMHFAELKKLQDNQYRAFTIYINEESFWDEPFVPEYLDTFTIYSNIGSKPDTEGKIEVWFKPTENSTLPPLINALEIYVIKELSQQETNPADGM